MPLPASCRREQAGWLRCPNHCEESFARVNEFRSTTISEMIRAFLQDDWNGQNARVASWPLSTRRRSPSGRLSRSYSEVWRPQEIGHSEVLCRHHRGTSNRIATRRDHRLSPWARPAGEQTEVSP